MYSIKIIVIAYIYTCRGYYTASDTWLYIPGVNTVLKACDFQEGESILSSTLTYGAISLTCRNAAARNKGNLATVSAVHVNLIKETCRILAFRW